MRDAEPKEPIRQVRTPSHRVYGARKIWRELNRQEHAVACCTVERLTREPGTAGAVRGKGVITTIPDRRAERAPDRVDRDVVVAAPNRCWVADFTYVAAWAPVVYVARASRVSRNCRRTRSRSRRTRNRWSSRSASFRPHPPPTRTVGGACCRRHAPTLRRAWCRSRPAAFHGRARRPGRAR
ncbi:IS3 family transposase [Streptomyces pimonensis]|uniref:IS3 family transposase n=1 Tax=Streptomyces pimonensis TaxID=2860288 RepID=A0ABV4J5S5_9ACTN